MLTYAVALHSPGGSKIVMKIKLCRQLYALLFSMLASLWSTGVAAVELNVTGFGTLGYAVSDQDFQYLRYIDNEGTLKADSLVGLQGEAQFNSQWGATLQVVASAPRTRDNGLETKIRWAFVSFRPDNDWLFRVGRQRPPFFIHSQNAEVGVTYDQVRLPAEVYTLSPIYDFDGGAVTKTWALENAELNLDAYWGKSDTAQRFFQRDARLINYEAVKVESSGLILSYTTDALLLRGGAHLGNVERKNGQPFVDTFSPTPIPAPPPFGGTLYLPSGSPSKIGFTVLTLGGDWRTGDWRITGEYGQRIITDTKIGAGSKSAYVTVARQIGKWTPYMTQARLLSDSDTRKLYQAVNGTPVPPAVQGPPQFLPANLHRMLADNIIVYDQYSTMLGASYSFSPTSKAKFEWMRTRIGLASSLVDGDIRNKSFNLFSVSYSVAF